eukprot:3124114-Prymnesium_polylepis.1
MGRGACGSGDARGFAVPESCARKLQRPKPLVTFITAALHRACKCEGHRNAHGRRGACSLNTYKARPRTPYRTRASLYTNDYTALAFTVYSQR